MTTSNRPLSPHLSIYRPQITSVLSISHRLTGVYLYVGLLIFSWLFIFSGLEATSFGDSYIAVAKSFFGSIIGKTAYFFWLFALYYHFCNGIRHLVWDSGRGFEKKSVVRSGIIVIAVSISLTGYSWFKGVGNFIN